MFICGKKHLTIFPIIALVPNDMNVPDIHARSKNQLLERIAGVKSRHHKIRGTRAHPYGLPGRAAPQMMGITPEHAAWA
jgi:hypothetical protein